MVQRVFSTFSACDCLAWVPRAALSYLDHTELGIAIRAIARRGGCHASTVLRQVRRTEARRDDPLTDAALDRLAQLGRADEATERERTAMYDEAIFDEGKFKREALRVLRAMSGPGALLAVLPDADTAVVLRESQEDAPVRLATVERQVAEALALKEWIRAGAAGRVLRYVITPDGRMALNRLLAETESRCAGFAEAPVSFLPRDSQRIGAGGTGRAAQAEEPVQVLARRRDPNGQPYLSAALISTAERLKTDYELLRVGGHERPEINALIEAAAQTSDGAGARLGRAIACLGPELGRVALGICCEMKGMETVEAEMAMPARSGKYVLRIALNMLHRHYSETAGDDADLIY